MKLSTAKSFVGSILGMAHTRLFNHMARSGLILSAIPLVSDKLDAIPEAQRALYVERDGKFHLDVTGYEDPAGLKSALDKERIAARNFEKQSKAWAALGKTPEEISELLELQRKADEDKMNKAGEWDRLKAQMNDQHTVALTAERAKSEAKDKALAKHLVDAAAVSALAAAKGVPELLLPHIRNAVKVIEENGEYAVRVLDSSGSPRVNGKGEFLSITDLVSEMRTSDVFSRAFDASGVTGGGAAASAGSRTGPDLSKLSPTERLTAARAGAKK